MAGTAALRRTPATACPASPGPGKDHRSEAQETQKASAEQLRKVWDSIADDVTAPHMAGVVAAEKWLDREEGKPRQTGNLWKITCMADLTDEELAEPGADFEAGQERQ